MIPEGPPPTTIFQAGPLAIALSVFTGAASASAFQNHTYDYIVVGGLGADDTGRATTDHNIIIGVVLEG
jgi:hypothetical protein